MTIHLAQHHGLCFGVRDALAQAETLAREAPLTILGELVHNPVARERLVGLGAREGSLENFAGALAADDGGNARVLITAHGASDERRRAWMAAGFNVADATCPLVRRAHRALAELVAAGCHPVVIGRHGHAEVRGLTGDFPAASVVQDEADVDRLPTATEISRLGVVAQTTQPPDRVATLLAAIRRARPGAEVRFRDTVCQPTKDRQTALRALLAEVDAVVVVGGRNSHNTRQLALAAEAAGRKVLQVERTEELQAAWFTAGERVGLTAGTSTLPETIAAVRTRLEAIAMELAGNRQRCQTEG